MSPELLFDSVTKSFAGNPAVTDASFSVTAGERVAIIGPSGAGKTTLLRLASGAISPDSGRVSLDGDVVTGGRVALAYHGDTLIGRRSALSNVLVGRIGSLPWWRGLLEPLAPIDQAPALSLLEAMGIADKADSRVDSLSGGERQRVALARALIQDAPVLLADEPTTNLDPNTRDTVLAVLNEAVADRLFVTVLHDVDLVHEHFERVIGIANGRIQFDRPTESMTEALLADLFGGEERVWNDGEKQLRDENGTGGSDPATVPPAAFINTHDTTDARSKFN